MSTTRVFGNSPFEVYLKPTNKIEVKVSRAGSFQKGNVVAYGSGGSFGLANASDRVLSSVFGVVTSVTANTITVVTQGFIPDADALSLSGQSGTVFYLSDTNPGKLTPAPPVALGTTRIPVLQKVDGGYLVLGMPGVVNGLSYRGYVNISAVQPVGTLSPFVGSEDSVPKNWLFCDGSYVSIDTYSELYRLVGSIYGPVQDGRFKLPDFRGRTLVGAGGGSGLSNRLIGEFGGEEQHQLSIAEMPNHNHRPAVGTNDGVDHWWGSDERIGSPNFDYDGSSSSKPSDGFLAPSYKTDSVGGNSPHNNMPPYAVANWIIRAKAETEFALLDVNVQSLTDVEKGITASDGDTIRYDGQTWRFVQNSMANLTDLVTNGVAASDIVVVSSVTNGVPTFSTIPPTGTNISINTTPRTHKNGSARPAAVATFLGNTGEAPPGRKGMVHISGTLEIEPTNGSVDGIVNVNIIGYEGSAGVDALDTVTIPHYVNGGIKKMKIPFYATVASQIYAANQGSGPQSFYRFSYYLSTDTGSQFKANQLTINNVKFVY